MRSYREVVDFVLAVVVVVAILSLPLLGFRLARPKPRYVPPDLRRADDAEASMPDAATVMEQVEGTVTQSWPMK
jgi:hypothetical protein